MKLKKFFAGLMAVLMCFSGGHYVYAESEVKVTVCTPTGGTGYRYGYNDFSTQYDDSGNQYAMMTPGETYTSYVFTEAGYETYWYLCDGYISDPDEQNLIYRGQKYDFVAKASDDGKYLIAVIRVFDETFTVTVDTAGHGDNMVFNNVQGGTEVTTLINDAIADGQITHRDGDKIIAGFYLDSEYTKSPDLVPADEYRVNRNMTVYVKWADEIKEMRRYYDEDIAAKGGKIPAALYGELDKLEKRFNG